MSNEAESLSDYYKLEKGKVVTILPVLCQPTIHYLKRISACHEVLLDNGMPVDILLSDDDLSTFIREGKYHTHLTSIMDKYIGLEDEKGHIITKEDVIDRVGYYYAGVQESSDGMHTILTNIVNRYGLDVKLSKVNQISNTKNSHEFTNTLLSVLAAVDAKIYYGDKSGLSYSAGIKNGINVVYDTFKFVGLPDNECNMSNIHYDIMYPDWHKSILFNERITVMKPKIFGLYQGSLGELSCRVIDGPTGKTLVSRRLKGERQAVEVLGFGECRTSCTEIYDELYPGGYHLEWLGKWDSTELAKKVFINSHKLHNI